MNRLTKGLILLTVLLIPCAAPGCGESDGGAAPSAPDPDDGPYAGMAPSGCSVERMLAISSHMSKSPNPSATRDFEIEKLTESGVRLLRTDFKWSIIEAADDQWDWQGYDVLVDLCRGAGIRVNALLDYGVDWARPPGEDSRIDPQVWADFNGEVAAHYADQIDVYEIWNEQNTQRFWKPYPEPAHYGRLLAAGYRAIHASDPGAVVLFGGMSPMDIHMFGPNGVWNFLVRTAEAHPDLCEHFDGLAIHPYTFLQQSAPEEAVSVGSWAYPDLVAMVDHARGLLERIGCPDKPIHFTEVGWPDLLIGRDRQAAYLARGLVLAASRGVRSYYWYTFWDGSGDAELPTEDAFGLFTWPRDDPDEKPSYRALRAANDILGGQRYAGDLGAALEWSTDLYAQAFTDEGSGAWTVVLWHARRDLEERVPVEVPLHPRASGAWEVRDQEGAPTGSGATSEGTAGITLTGAVSYLRFAVR